MKVVDSTGATVDAQLMAADGSPTQYQATHVGIAGADCANTVNCAPLTNLQTLDVGTANADGTTGFAKDFFIAFQKQAVNWQSNATAGTTITAAPGVFFNLPTAMTVDIQALQTGLPRARTEYIDRGVGLFRPWIGRG